MMMTRKMCETCYHARISDNGRHIQCLNPYLRDRDDTGGKAFFSKRNRPDAYNCEFHESVHEMIERQKREISRQRVMRKW